MESAPRDHFAASPDRRVIVTGERDVCDAGGSPTIRVGIISATGVKIESRAAKNASPDDHFTGGPQGCVRVARRGCIVEACGDPTVRARVVSAAGIGIIECFIHSAPDNHLIASPDYRVVNPA